MMTEVATAFAERLKSDEAFQSRLAGAETGEARLAIAREEGFELSADDVGAVKSALGLQALSDEELERIAGGIGTTTTATIAVGSAASAGAVAGEVAAAFV
jgi:predicted ribosomally synthesized peptide with nif11-like leader